MTLVNTLFNGLSLSSIILLTSLGLAITFGLMRVINMAHGEFLMIGAYMTYVVQELFSKLFPEQIQSAYYFAAIIVSFAVTFALGCIMEKFIVSRLYGREIDSLLATWGISLILQQAARSIFGTQGVNVNAPSFLQGGLNIGSCTFSYNRMFIIGITTMMEITPPNLKNRLQRLKSRRTSLTMTARMTIPRLLSTALHVPQGQ